MNEVQLERRVVNYARKLGVYCRKCEDGAGFPDREFLFPGGHVRFIELKNPDGKGRLAKAQKLQIAKLKRLGFPCLVTHDFDEAAAFLREGLSDS